MRVPLSPAEINSIYSLFDSTYLFEEAVARPVRMLIEVTSICNLRCYYCPRQIEGYDYEDGVIDFENFKQLLPELPWVREVTLYGLGEPFLHKRFFEMHDLVKQFGLYTSTTNNGTMLKPRIIEKILANPLDEIFISIDSHDPERFAQLREGGDLDEIIENIRSLERAKKERGLSRPKLMFNASISRHNVRDMAGIVRLCAQLGGQFLSFTNIRAHLSKDEPAVIWHTPEFEEQLATALAEGRRLGLETRYYEQYPYLEGTQPPPAVAPGHYGCTEIWQAQGMEFNGKQNQCCFIHDTYADTFADGILAAHNHANRRALRRQLLNGDVRYPCSFCYHLEQVTPERCERIFATIARELRNPRLPRPDRQRMRELLKRYRARARELFSPAAGGGNGSRRLIQPLKSLIQSLRN